MLDALGGNHDAKPVPSNGALDGAAPTAFVGLDFDELADEGQLMLGDVKLCCEVRSELLIMSWDVGSGTCASLLHICCELVEFFVMALLRGTESPGFLSFLGKRISFARLQLPGSRLIGEDGGDRQVIVQAKS